MCVVPLIRHGRDYRFRRASPSGIIFLTWRHRKLGRTRVVDTVHSELPPLSRLCVCPPALESRIEIGIGVSRSLQITFDRPSHTRSPFTKPVQTYHEPRRVNRGFHNSSKLTLDRACILYWEAKQLGDRVGFARERQNSKEFAEFEW